MRNNLITVLKGLIVGGTMLVPGVSGGSMMMILGIYDRVVSAVSSFFKNVKGNLLLLLLFVAGAGTGMLLFAKPLLSLIENELFRLPTLYFFLGAVAGGIPLILKQAKVERFSWQIPVWIALGLAVVWLCSLLPSAGADSRQEGLAGMAALMLAGVLAAVALVLPGISVSSFLLMLGLYDEMIYAISELYLPFLVPLAVGLMLGVILTTKVLEYAMKTYPLPSYLMILGFVVGSLAEVFPGVPMGWNIPVCLVTLVAGFAAIRLLGIFAGEE